MGDACQGKGESDMAKVHLEDGGDKGELIGKESRGNLALRNRARLLGSDDAFLHGQSLRAD